MLRDAAGDAHDALDLVWRVFGEAELVMYKRKCRLCGQDVVFINGPKGKTMVFDAKPYDAWYLDEVKNLARCFKAHRPHQATCTGYRAGGTAG